MNYWFGLILVCVALAAGGVSMYVARRRGSRTPVRWFFAGASGVALAFWAIWQLAQWCQQRKTGGS